MARPSCRFAPAADGAHGMSLSVRACAIVEQLDGRAVEWTEKVTDEEYATAARHAGEG